MSDAAIADRLESVRSAIADAAREAGRADEAITTIVVTKFQPASLVRELAALGVHEVGESRHQEAVKKAEELAGLGLHWHFVGQLQSNKAKAVRRYAEAIHSVDRPALLDALAGDGRLDVFLQVNLTGDPRRGGVRPDDLLMLAERALVTPGIRLLGLMAVAPLGTDPRPAFARVRELGEGLRSVAPEATALSMGMSADFREAVLEGATHLRIGTAITGKRPERR